MLPSFIEQLSHAVDKKTNKKLEPIISFYFSNTNKENGKIQIGGYNLKKYGKEDSTDKDIKWSNLAQNNDYFWTLGMSKAKLYGGKPKNPNELFGDIDMTSKYVMIDTGMSFAMAPQKDIISIVDALNKTYGIPC